MEDDFEATARQAESDILAGALYAGDDYPKAQQVHRSSWKYLAKINGLGLVTWTSQDALSGLSKAQNMSERSYLKGHMLLERARRFCTLFNISHNDMLAMTSLPYPKDDLKKFWHGGRYLGITNREVKEETGELKIRGVMPGIDDERMWYHRCSLIGVHVIDLHWGRSATSKKGLWRAVIQVLLKMCEE